MKNRIALVIAVCLVGPVVVGCGGPKLRPEAAKVQVVAESEIPLHCKRLGSITGKASADTEKAARDAAIVRFRNEAAQRGANYAFISQENGGTVGTTGALQVAVVGRALNCTDADSERTTDGGAAAPPM
jgi:hypothetical protein